MKKKNMSLLAALLFCSCGVLNDKHVSRNLSDSSFETATDLKSKTVTDKTDHSIRLVAKDDSLHQSWDIQLWPKGKFAFSPDGGFEGEAEKVMIKGDLNGRTKYKMSEATTKESKSNIENGFAQTQKQKQEEKQVERSSQVNITSVVLLGFLIIICFLTIISVKFNWLKIR